MKEASRIQLIKRLCDLPDHHLEHVSEMFSRLEGKAGPAESSDSPCPPSPQDINPNPHPKSWPHAPTHRLSDHGTYMVTGGTLYKFHYFREPESLDLLESCLLRIAKEYGWQLEAWAVFSNHYHFVAHALSGAAQLGGFYQEIAWGNSSRVESLARRGRTVCMVQLLGYRSDLREVLLGSTELRAPEPRKARVGRSR
jgi:hypothetical protein